MPDNLYALRFSKLYAYLLNLALFISYRKYICRYTIICVSIKSSKVGSSFSFKIKIVGCAIVGGPPCLSTVVANKTFWMKLVTLGGDHLSTDEILTHVTTVFGSIVVI